MFVKFFGALGYLAVALQWLWSVILYFSFIKILSSSMTKGVELKSELPATVELVSLSPDIFTIIFLTIIFLVMIVLAIYSFIKIPTTIVKTSKKLVTDTANSFVPLLLRIQHKKDTKIKRKKLTAKIILVIKILIIIIPFILTLLTYFYDDKMVNYNISMIVGVYLAVSSILLFSVQYFLAYIFKVSKDKIQ